jgi:hypothetical protein
MHQIELSPEKEQKIAQEQFLPETRVGRLHPQLALWLVRGVLGASIASIAFALLPGNSVQPSVSQTATFAVPAAGHVPVVLASTESIQRVESQVATAFTPLAHETQLKNADEAAPPVPSNSARTKYSAAHDKASKPSRTRNRYRANRSAHRPLTALARGAKRTFRTVGRSIARLL